MRSSAVFGLPCLRRSGVRTREGKRICLASKLTVTEGLGADGGELFNARRRILQAVAAGCCDQSMTIKMISYGP